MFNTTAVDEGGGGWQWTNRVHSNSPVHTYVKALHEEICELRSESWRLRHISHQMSEENHRLKEELWDMKKQYERFMHLAVGKQDA